MSLFGIGPPGFGSGFATQTIARQKEKRSRAGDIADQQREALKGRIASIGKLHLPSSYEGEKTPNMPYLTNLVEEGLMSQEQVDAIQGSHKAGQSKNMFDAAEKLLKNYSDSTLHMSSWQEHFDSRDPVTMYIATVANNPRHRHYGRLFMPYGGPRELYMLNMRGQKKKQTDAFDKSLRANKEVSWNSQLGFELGKHFRFNEKLYNNSSLGAGTQLPAVIGGEGNDVLEIMKTQTMYANKHMLDNIESTLARDPNILKGKGNDRLKNLINRLVQPLTQYTATGVADGTQVTYPPDTVDQILEDKPNIRNVLAHKMTENDIARAKNDKIETAKGVTYENPSHIVPTGVIRVKSQSRKRWERKARTRPDRDMKLVKALDVDGTHSWFTDQSNLGKAHLGNSLSYKTNIELGRLMGIIGKTKRGDKANTQASQALVNMWHEKVMGGTGDLVNSMTDLYKNIIVLSDLQAKHFEGVLDEAKGKVGIPLKSLYFEAAEEFKKTPQVEKDIISTNIKLKELGGDLTSLLQYLVDKDPNTGLDIWFGETEHANKMIGLRPRIEQWVAGGLEYMEELASFAFGTKEKGKDEFLETTLQRSDSEFSAKNKSALERLSKRVSALRENWDTATPAFKKRAIVEFKKLALTYQLSGMVQGDQTGGRTISNQDFEVMLKALWGGPQAASTARLQELLQRVEFRRAVGEMTLFTRKQGTYDKTVSGNSMVDSVLDRIKGEFKRRIDARDADPRSSVDLEDIGKDETIRGNIDVRSSKGVKHFRDKILVGTFNRVLNASTIGIGKKWEDKEHVSNVMELVPTDVRKKYSNINLTFDNEDRLTFTEMPKPVNNVVQFDSKRNETTLETLPVARDETELLEHLYHQTVYLPRFLSNVAYNVHNRTAGFQGEEGKFKLGQAYNIASSAFTTDKKHGIVYFKSLLQMSGITDKKTLETFTQGYLNMLGQLYDSGMKPLYGVRQ